MIIDDAIKFSILAALLRDKHSFTEIFSYTNRILKNSKMRTISKTTFSEKLSTFTTNHPDSLATDRRGPHVPRSYDPRSYYYILNPDDLTKIYYSVLKVFRTALKKHIKKIQQQKSSGLIFSCVRMVDEILTLKKLSYYLISISYSSKVSKKEIKKIERDLDGLIEKTFSLLRKKEPNFVRQFDNIIMSRLIVDDVVPSHTLWDKFFTKISIS